MSKLTIREALARSFPERDHAMADRLIRWLDHCGYEIVEQAPHHESSSIAPSEATPHHVAG